MFCKKCGRQIENDSIFCKYCGSNNLNNTQINEKEAELNKNITDTSVISISTKNRKNSSLRNINLYFIILLLLASVFFIPFKQYFRGVVRRDFTFENIEYRHFFNLPKDVKSIWTKPEGSLVAGEFDIKYNLHY